MYSHDKKRVGEDGVSGKSEQQEGRLLTQDILSEEGSGTVAGSNGEGPQEQARLQGDEVRERRSEERTSQSLYIYSPWRNS